MDIDKQNLNHTSLRVSSHRNLGFVLKVIWAFLVAQDSTESACNVGDPGSITGSGRSPRKGNGNPLHYSCLDYPMDEEPGELQSMSLQRVGHNWATNTKVIKLPL